MYPLNYRAPHLLLCVVKWLSKHMAGLSVIFKCINPSISIFLFLCFLSIIPAFKFSGKKEEMKINVKEGKSLAAMFCYVARPFPFLPVCPLCSQPLPALLRGVALSQILDFAFHIIPCLQPAKVPLKSSTSTSPKFQRVLSAPLPESLKSLNNVSPSTDPEEALVTGHQLGLPLHFHLSISAL